MRSLRGDSAGCACQRHRMRGERLLPKRLVRARGEVCMYIHIYIYMYKIREALGRGDLSGLQRGVLPTCAGSRWRGREEAAGSGAGIDAGAVETTGGIPGPAEP